MEERCIVCGNVIGLEKRVNIAGEVFCSDRCYEKHNHAVDDFSHPYIDDYDMIRLEYIWWMENFENELYRGYETGEPEKEELLEDLDVLFDEFYDYYRLEGEDGIFSQEIYRYLLELEGLRKTIEKWEPESICESCKND